MEHTELCLWCDTQVLLKYLNKPSSLKESAMTLIAHKIKRTSWEDKVHLVSNHISFTMENMELRKQCKNRKKKNFSYISQVTNPIGSFNLYSVYSYSKLYGTGTISNRLDVEKRKIQNNHEQATLVEKGAP